MVGTPIGLAAVLVTREKSLRVSDMAGLAAHAAAWLSHVAVFWQEYVCKY